MVGLFVKIIQKDTAATNVRFCILPHLFEFVHVYVLLSTGLGELRQLDDVGQRVEQHGIGRCAITPCTANLLIEALDAFGHVIMDNPTDVALVNAHAESNSGTHYLYLVILETFLRLITFLTGKSSVISHCVYSFGF